MKTHRVYSLFVLTTLLSAGTLSAAPRQMQGTPDPTFVPSKPAPLSLTIVTDKTQYKRGDKVTFLITVRNVSEKPQQLNFPNSQEFDVTAASGKTSPAKWQWSWGASRLFAAQLHSLKLAPGATKLWRVTWDQRAFEGQSPLTMPGKHRAIAKLTTQKIVQSNVTDLNIVS